MINFLDNIKNLYKEHKFYNWMMNLWNKLESSQTDYESRMSIILKYLAKKNLKETSRVIEKLKALPIKKHIYPAVYRDLESNSMTLEEKKRFLDYCKVIVPSFEDEFLLSFVKIFISNDMIEFMKKRSDLIKSGDFAGVDALYQSTNPKLESAVQETCQKIVDNTDLHYFYKDTVIPTTSTNDDVQLKVSFLDMHCPRWRDIIIITFEQNVIKGNIAAVPVGRKFKL